MKNRMDEKKRVLQNNPSQNSPLCPQCGKTKRVVQKGSLTSWIFAESRCQCQIVQTEPNSAHGSNEAPTIPEYEIVELLGHGGMGSVYKVKRKIDDQIFALKIMRRELVNNVAAVKRFEQEVKACMSLSNSNLVSVHGLGHAEDGSPYLVMDYLEGESLQQILAKDGILDVNTALPIFIQICDGLSHVHQNGIVHRDIKPSNIMVALDNETNELRVKLLDFGIARVTDDQNLAQSLTSTGEIFGSPFYMSPEQCKGDLIDTKSDIYSLGCVLYETLSGKPPFAGNNPVQTILKHLNEQPKPLTEKQRSMSNSLESVLFKCLEKDPQDRYESIEDLRRDLKYLSAGLEPLVPLRKKIKPKIDSKTRVRRIFSTLLILVGMLSAGALLLMASTPTIGSMTAKINKNPDDGEALSTRGNLYRLQGDYDRSIADLSAAIKLLPDNAALYRWRGSSYTSLNKLDLARADLLESIKLDPNALAYLELGRLYYELGDYEQSIKASTRATELGSSVAPFPAGVRELTISGAFTNRANAYLQRREYAQAIADCDSALKACPDATAPYLIRTQAKLGAGFYKNSVDDATTYLEYFANDETARYTRGVARIGLAQFAGAEQDFTYLLEHAREKGTPNLSALASYYQLRATARMLNGDYKAAIDDFNKSETVVPMPLDYIPKLAEARILDGQFVDATKDLNRYISSAAASKHNVSPIAMIQLYLLEKLLKHSPSAMQFRSSSREDAELKDPLIEDWSSKMINYLIGNIDEKTLLAEKTVNSDSLTATKTYVGMNLLADGHKAEAVEHFEWVKTNGDKTRVEYQISLSFLKRLTGN